MIRSRCLRRVIVYASAFIFFTTMAGVIFISLEDSHGFTIDNFRSVLYKRNASLNMKDDLEVKADDQVVYFKIPSDDAGTENVYSKITSDYSGAENVYSRISSAYSGAENVYSRISSDNFTEEDMNSLLSSESIKLINDARGKLFCDFTVTREMDIMQMKMPTFIKRFKNPCWYAFNRLWCIPYMYIVGADKCGTTDLYKKIAQHPDFVEPSKKEPLWMPVERFLRSSSIYYYVETYFYQLTDILSDIRGPSKLITGDANVFNLEGTPFWPYLGANIGQDEPEENTADYIYHLNSNAKILINVRNPIDKLWSEYLALSRRAKNKSAEHFHEIVVRGVSLYRDCFRSRTVRSCMHDRDLPMLTIMNEVEREAKLEDCRYQPVNAVYMRTGVYHVFIKDYLNVFPRDQVLIQRLEDIAENGRDSLIKTYEFLDLELPDKFEMERILGEEIWNTRKPKNVLIGEMWNSTRRLLYQFYKPHNEQLAALLNDSKYNYGLSS